MKRRMVEEAIGNVLELAMRRAAQGFLLQLRDELDGVLAGVEGRPRREHQDDVIDAEFEDIDQ